MQTLVGMVAVCFDRPEDLVVAAKFPPFYKFEQQPTHVCLLFVSIALQQLIGQNREIFSYLGLQFVQTIQKCFFGLGQQDLCIRLDLLQLPQFFKHQLVVFMVILLQMPLKKHFEGCSVVMLVNLELAKWADQHIAGTCLLETYQRELFCVVVPWAAEVGQLIDLVTYYHCYYLYKVKI